MFFLLIYKKRLLSNPVRNFLNIINSSYCDIMIMKTIPVLQELFFLAAKKQL